MLLVDDLACARQSENLLAHEDQVGVGEAVVATQLPVEGQNALVNFVELLSDLLSLFLNSAIEVVKFIAFDAVDRLNELLKFG